MFARGSVRTPVALMNARVTPKCRRGERKTGGVRKEAAGLSHGSNAFWSRMVAQLLSAFGCSHLCDRPLKAWAEQLAHFLHAEVGKTLRR